MISCRCKKAHNEFQEFHYYQYERIKFYGATSRGYKIYTGEQDDKGKDKFKCFGSKDFNTYFIKSENEREAAL